LPFRHAFALKYMNSGYIRSLDGIRTLAVFLVIFLHWPLPALHLPFGWLGVNIFFVLSGFLITRILIQQKNQQLAPYLKHFYRNRLLRIFPLFYSYLAIISIVLLVVGWLLPDNNQSATITSGLNVLRDHLFLLLTYTYNFADLFHPDSFQPFSNRFFAHLWSLAVEEQFYLVFPFLVFFLKPQHLRYFLIALIFLTPPLRIWYGEAMRGTQPEILTGIILSKVTFFHTDGFALGGLLALLPRLIPRKPHHWFIAFTMLLFALGLAEVWYLKRNGIAIGWKSLGLDHPLEQFGQHSSNLWFQNRYAFTYTLVNLLAFFLLASALQQNFIQRFLEWRPLRFTGKISYGIYIFHFPVSAGLIILLDYFNHTTKISNSPVTEALTFIIYIMVVLLISWLSFRFFESRFLKLKRPATT
jgi:peptidoglycan/LPS O-acetylase OafA/YrhL